MKKVFAIKKTIAPEEYLRNMLDCIKENGELEIAREIDDVTFCTADSEEYASHIEKIKLETDLADYDKIYAFYKNVLKRLEDGSFWNEYSPLVGIGKYGDRMVRFARRIDLLHKMETPDAKVPQLILQNEKCLLIDSIVLYLTNATGELCEKKK